MAASAGPHLTVVSEGPLKGHSFAVHPGASQSIGRAVDADLVIDSPNVSRRHAYLSWDGQQLRIADAGSTNGTSVNGQQLAGAAWRALRTGELVGLGDLVLQVDAPVSDATGQMAAPARAPASRPAFRNELANNYGMINQAGGDLNQRIWNETHNEQENPMDEIVRGRGAGRALVVLGLIIALSGFALWMSMIFSGFTNTKGTGNPLDKHILGLPAAPTGFGAFAIGGLIMAMGVAMSRAAREREFRSGR